MLHNSHTIVEAVRRINGGPEEPVFFCKSHNFPTVIGTGSTEEQSIRDMQQKIIYVMDNDPTAVKRSIEQRKALDNTCLCGSGAPWSEALVVVKNTGLAPVGPKGPHS